MLTDAVTFVLVTHSTMCCRVHVTIYHYAPDVCTQRIMTIGVVHYKIILRHCVDCIINSLATAWSHHIAANGGAIDNAFWRHEDMQLDTWTLSTRRCI